MGEFPRGRGNTEIVGKLEKLVENRGEFSFRTLRVENLIWDIVMVDVG